MVLALYEALASRDAHEVSKLLASDLEWWFHGPPSHQFLMRLLTGITSDGQDSSFVFTPQSTVAFGSLVIAEGCDHSRSISWVHAWTVTDGIITQVKEYLNTSVTVTRLGNNNSSNIATASSEQNQIRHHYCQPLWESSVANRGGKSVPGLVLAL